jgi:hypothetical protein
MKDQKMFRLVCLALATVSLLSTPAMAGGGGGAKKDATIKFVHDLPIATIGRVGVILDQTAAQLTAIASASDRAAAFTKAGGKFVDNGQSSSFKVLSGDHVVTIVSPTAFTVVKSINTNVASGRTREVKASQ